MSLLNVPAGKDLPSDFNVIIEIPANGQLTKYELDKDTGILTVDRFMPTSMIVLPTTVMCRQRCVMMGIQLCVGADSSHGASWQHDSLPCYRYASNDRRKWRG